MILSATFFEAPKLVYVKNFQQILLAFLFNIILFFFPFPSPFSSISFLGFYGQVFTDQKEQDCSCMLCWWVCFDGSDVSSGAIDFHRQDIKLPVGFRGFLVCFCELWKIMHLYIHIV